MVCAARWRRHEGKAGEGQESTHNGVHSNEGGTAEGRRQKGRTDDEPTGHVGGRAAGIAGAGRRRRGAETRATVMLRDGLKRLDDQHRRVQEHARPGPARQLDELRRRRPGQERVDAIPEAAAASSRSTATSASRSSSTSTTGTCGSSSRFRFRASPISGWRFSSCSRSWCCAGRTPRTTSQAYDR